MRGNIRAVLSGITAITLSCSLVLSLPHQTGAAQRPRAKVRFLPALVVDDRLSALRRAPDQKSLLLHRMHLGRKVYIIGSKQSPGQPPFYRVALTRRTRGWVHQGALAIPGRAGEDRRIWNLASASKDLDLMALCRVLIDHFPQSPVVPAALGKIGEEAERAARSLTRRARRRLADVRTADAMALRDFYLNDPALDRYNKLGVRFDFDETAREFVYDQQAYRELIHRYPTSAEAELALKRLARRQGGMAVARR